MVPVHVRSNILSFLDPLFWSSYCSISKSDIFKTVNIVDFSHKKFQSLNFESIFSILYYFKIQKVILSTQQVLNLAPCFEKLTVKKKQGIQNNVDQITFKGLIQENRIEIKIALNILLKKLGNQQFNELVRTIKSFSIFKELTQNFSLIEFNRFLQNTFKAENTCFEMQLLFSSQQFIDFVLDLCVSEITSVEQKNLYFNVLIKCCCQCHQGQIYLTRNERNAHLTTDLVMHALKTTHLTKEHQIRLTAILTFGLNRYFQSNEVFTSNYENSQEFAEKLVHLIVLDTLDSVAKVNLAELISNILCKSSSGQTIFLENKALTVGMLEHFSDLCVLRETCVNFKLQATRIIKYLTKNNTNAANLISSNSKYVTLLTKMATLSPTNHEIQMLVLNIFIQLTEINTQGQKNLFNSNELGLEIANMLVFIARGSGQNNSLRKETALCISNLCQGSKVAQTCFFQEDCKEAVINMVLDLMNYSSFNDLRICYAMNAFYDLIVQNSYVKDFFLSDLEVRNQVFYILVISNNKQGLASYEREVIYRASHELTNEAEV